MERLTTWGVLAVVGAVVGFGVYLMASSHAPAFLAWLAGVSVLLNFIQAGMIGNARNAANRARDEATFYLENFRMPVNHQPVIEPVPSVEPSFIIDEGPDALARVLATAGSCHLLNGNDRRKHRRHGDSPQDSNRGTTHPPLPYQLGGGIGIQ